jgi:hypothetical protein
VTQELSLLRATPTTARDPNSARQYQRDISTLEAKGYAQALCTVDGMLMFNWRTGRFVTVSW